jgi:DNA-binding XRE family transcriptional regulator
MHDPRVVHQTFGLEGDAERPVPRDVHEGGAVPADPSAAIVRAMARKKLQPVTREDARAIGAMLRGLRRAAGYRAVQDAAAAGGFPAARQTIYAYERGGLTPSLQQFLEIIEFYALHPSRGDGTKPEDDLRAQAVASVTRALTLPAYHVKQAHELMERIQPKLAEGQRRKRRST